MEIGILYFISINKKNERYNKVEVLTNFLSSSKNLTANKSKKIKNKKKINKNNKKMMNEQNEILEIIKNDDKEALSKYEKTYLKEMKILIKLEYLVPNKDGDYASLLHVAAMDNAIKCFDYLLNDVQIPLNSKSKFGFLPIHYSLRFGFYEISSHILSIYKNNSSNPENSLENLFSQDYCNTGNFFNLLYNCNFPKNYEETAPLFDLLFAYGYDPNKIESFLMKQQILTRFILDRNGPDKIRFFIVLLQCKVKMDSLFCMILLKLTVYLWKN